MVPNFIIIGSARSGTTSLYHYLPQHPEIFMSPLKEPQYFAYEKDWQNWCGPGDRQQVASFIKHENDYKRLFANAKDCTATGEASTLCLYNPHSASRIATTLPRIKIIAILRDPAERAFSHYKRLRKSNRETLATFDEAIDAEPHRIANNYGWMWHYVNRGYYYRQLKPYFESFDPTQIKVLFLEDLKASPAALCQSIFSFLGVDDSFQVTASEIFADSVSQKNDNLLVKSGYRRNRSRLVNMYKDDILQLERLLQRDLSAWLKA